MTQKLALLGCSAALILAGCATDSNAPSGKQLAEMQKTLNEINHNLIELKKEMNKEDIAIPRISHTGSPAYLKIRIAPLPKNPTDQQIHNYIAKIQAATAGQNTFAPSDPQVQLYEKIGPGHLQLLLPYLLNQSLNTSYHLGHALPKLVSKNDKKLVLDNLRRCPALVKTVAANGWLNEAKDAIFDALRDGREVYMLSPFLAALVRSDADRKRVIDIYSDAPNAASLYGMISTYPGVNLPEITGKAWEHHRFSERWQALEYARNAALNGNIAALEQFINLSSNSNPGYYNEGHRSDLAILTNQPYEKIPEWFRRNKDNLVFNKERKCFEVRK